MINTDGSAVICHVGPMHVGLARPAVGLPQTTLYTPDDLILCLV